MPLFQLFKSVICVLTLYVATNASATAQNTRPIKLNFAHFMPAQSWQNQTMFLDWAKAVKEQSEGLLDITVFPAQTLGKAAAGYDNAKNGVADIVWTVQGYTANRFPLSHIVELPGLFKHAEVGSCAFQHLYDSGVLDAEYKDTHVLYVHTHGPGHLHTQDKPVTKVDDFKGLNIRRPTAVIAKLLEELGAEPVGMPAPAIYEAMQRKNIDGFMLPWEAVEGFRADEVSEHHTEFGFYSLAFVTAMNKATYEALPDAHKDIIDANSGMQWALIAGKGYDEGDVRGFAKTKQSGTIHQLDPEHLPKFEAAARRATEAYLDELEAKGLPGRATYKTFQTYIDQCQVELGYADRSSN